MYGKAKLRAQSFLRNGISIIAIAIFTLSLSACSTRKAAPANRQVVPMQDRMPVFGGGDSKPQQWWA